MKYHGNLPHDHSHDKIDEAYNRNGQRAHKVVTIEPPASHEGKNDALAAEVSRLREQIKAMGSGGYHRPRRRSNSLTRPRHRSRSRDHPRQDGICFYHARFGDRVTLVSGSRETIPAVRKSGGRRRLGISPHLYFGPENEDFVLS